MGATAPLIKGAVTELTAGSDSPGTEHSRHLCLQVTAATEHSRVTEISANVVFINIGWKESRMHNTPIRNMDLLGKMIAGIVRNMTPHDDLHVRSRRDKISREEAADATSRG